MDRSWLHLDCLSGAAAASARGRDALRAAGTLAGTVARRVAHRAAAAVVRGGVVHLYGWDLAATADLPAPKGFSARELDPIEQADVAARFGRLPGEHHRRVRLGDRCFGAFDGSRLVHVRWAARRPAEIPELGLLICPDVDEVYVYDSLTDPAFRGRGTSSVARALMARTLAGEGVRRAYAYVRGDNHASLGALGDYHQLLCVLPYRSVLGGPTRTTARFAHPLYWPEAVPLDGERRARAIAAGRAKGQEPERAVVLQIEEAGG